MTVNVALLTSDAIVFGCDSIASVTTPLVDPFSDKVIIKPAKGDSSKIVLELESANVIERYPTNTWDGVTKLFQIHDGDTPVAATTAGLAKLNGKTMEQIAHEFCEKSRERSRPRVNVEAVSNDFLRFLRKEYDKYYKDSAVGEAYRDGPEFLVGGYGKNDDFPSLYKVFVKENKSEPYYKQGNFGVAWNGQSTAVERFLKGYDYLSKYSVNKQHQDGLVSAHSMMTRKIAKILKDIVDKTGITLPEDLDIDLSLPKSKLIKLDDFHANISYESLPHQSAVDLVSQLVNLQAAQSKFESGIPTVGGRVLIGTLTKKEKSLKILGQRDLVHEHVGG